MSVRLRKLSFSQCMKSVLAPMEPVRHIVVTNDRYEPQKITLTEPKEAIRSASQFVSFQIADSFKELAAPVQKNVKRSVG